MRRLILCGLMAVTLLGCSQEITGSAPTIGDTETSLNTDPAFLCNEDPGSWVTLFGSDFSPLVIDAIATDNDPDVELPTIRLTLSATPTGGAPESEFSITLQSPLGSEDGDVRWLDDGTMHFRVSSDQELPAGVYDLFVENPNGETTTQPEAFGLIPRPSVAEAIPEMTCVAQGARDIVLEGSDFLILAEDYPTIRLDDAEVEVVDVAGCEELHPVYGDHQLCAQATVRIDEGALDAAVYDVSVENADPAGCTSLPENDEVTVTIVDPPVVDAISPTPVCGEQLDYDSMLVEGSGFVVLRGADQTAYPTVSIGDEVYTAFAAEGCEVVEDAPTLGAETCTQLTISIGADELASYVDEGALFGRPDIVVENPEPVGCHSTDERALTVVPPPSVASITPDPVCTAQFVNTITVDGTGFLLIDGALPQVRIGTEIYPIDTIDSCSFIANDGPQTESCESITLTIPAGDIPDPARTDVSVINPATAACESTDETTLQIVAPPTVAAIQPQPLCLADDTRTLEIDGTGFLSIDEDLPLVTIANVGFQSTEVADCEDLPLDDEDREVRRCTTLRVDIPASGLDPDIHDVIVTNPEPASCFSTEDLTLRTVAAPSITSVTPRAFCSTEDAIFDIEGDNLFEVDSIAPEILVDGIYYGTTGVNCADFEDADGVRLCEGLTLAVDADSISGILTMVAVNPEPIGCDSQESEPFYAAGPPAIIEAVPGAICDDATFDGNIRLFGEFIYDPAGDLPSVDVDGTTVSATIDDCETIDLGDSSVQSCSWLDITVPGNLDGDFFDINVAASAPLACGSDSITVERVASPSIVSVVPERVCSAGGTLSVQGTDLRDDTEFFLDGTAASEVNVALDGESAQVTFDGPLGGTTFRTLTAVTGGACSDEYETEIRIYDGPQPIFVDPPVVYGQMNTQVTIYAAGLFGGAIDVVELLHPDGQTITELDYEEDANNPSVILATIPEGILDIGTDSGSFGIRLTDNESCTDQTSALLTITNELTVAIEDIDPPFGAQDQSTGVSITAVDPLEDGSDQVQFSATPRAYLNPSDLADGTLASEIRAIQFLDETELNGIVPSDLSVGTYDLIVVNPDGSVGVLDDAFDITAERPPLVDTVIPGAWDTGDAALPVTIEGENFRPGATIEVFCRDSDSTETDEDLLQQPNSIIIDSVEDDRVLATVDATNLPDLIVCYMRLTNPDGTYGEYNPITTVNSSGKFMEFSPGVAFDTARRGPTSFSGVPSRTARYLYVIGGDDGTEENAYTSGEFASLNRFGAPRSWNYLPYDLPTGRSLANGERIGDFLYLVGGSDEGTPSDEVLRARVLDPQDVPNIVNVDLEFDEENYFDDGGGETSSLDRGVYYYRVSAVYGPGDPANPEGESLASEPQPISIPVDGLSVTIGWEPPAYINHQIVEYRIYRSVNPDDPYGGESLLATVDAATSSYTDDGSVDPVAGANPLAVGSLGMWHTIATLNHPRQVAGITWSPNPDNAQNDVDQFFIYAIGGEDSNGRRADYEFITVDNFGTRDQEVTPFATVGQTDINGQDEDMLLPEARAELAAVVAYERNASVVADVAPQIFVYGGRTASTDTQINVTSVTATGHLLPWTSLSNNRQLSGGTRAGHGAAIMNNELIYVGGAGGDPSDGGFHSNIQCDDTFCPPARVASNYSNLSALEMEPRVWMGNVPFSGFFYLMGGLTTGNIPTNTVDYSVAGGAP